MDWWIYTLLFVAGFALGGLVVNLRWKRKHLQLLKRLQDNRLAEIAFGPEGYRARSGGPGP